MHNQLYTICVNLIAPEKRRSVALFRIPLS